MNLASAKRLAKTDQAIEHQGETVSNQWRQRAATTEPRSLRTFTPSQAVIARSEGSFHFTPEGRRLADFSSGVPVANLGHNPRAWWERVMQWMQLENLSRTASPDTYVSAAPLTAYNAITPLEVEAAERLLQNMQSQPGGQRMEQVLWAASGSEAIQKALWCTMQHQPNRSRILATRHGFHGKKGLAGAVTGCEQDKERDPRVRFIAFPRAESCSVQASQIAPQLDRFRQELDQIVDEQGDEIAGLVTEPYLGGGGSFHPHPEYLRLLQDYCQQQGWVFILDEIQSCFGRTGPMYAFTRYGLEPDIVCLGKGMGNGVPVSAMVGRADIVDCLDYGECSDTWSANPLSSAAVLATLDLFEQTDVLQQGERLSSVLERGLLQLVDTGLVKQVRGEGCVWGIECAEFGGHSAAEIARACVRACYLGNEDGHSIHLLGPLAGCVIRVSPPLTMELADAELYLQAMQQIFEQLASQLSTPVAR